MLQGEEVGRVAKEALLLGRERRQAAPNPPPHARGVVPRIERVGKPAQIKFHRALRGQQVRRSLARGLAPIGVEGNGDEAALRRLELAAVARRRVRVREQHVVRRDVGLARRPNAPPGRVLAARVPIDRVVGGLVEGDPVLDAVAEALKAKRRVLHERARRRFREPPVVLQLQCERKIPVVERDDRVDAVGDELVDELGVEADALLVHRPVAERQHPRPRDGEAVVPQAHLRHQLDV